MGTHKRAGRESSLRRLREDKLCESSADARAGEDSTAGSSLLLVVTPFADDHHVLGLILDFVSDDLRHPVLKIDRYLSQVHDEFGFGRPEMDSDNKQRQRQQQQQAASAAAGDSSGMVVVVPASSGAALVAGGGAGDVKLSIVELTSLKG
jgi:hypothetical protein